MARPPVKAERLRTYGATEVARADRSRALPGPVPTFRKWRGNSRSGTHRLVNPKTQANGTLNWQTAQLLDGAHWGPQGTNG